MKLYNKIKGQIHDLQLQDEVEVLHFLDNKENSVGYKRNELLERASGKFLCFVDDDDDVSGDYISLIYKAIQSNPDIDCIGIKGQITFSGRNPKVFIHSLKYDDYSEDKRTYYRPPNHLNPIRSSIAKKFPFELVNFGEDHDYAMRMCDQNVLKKEHYIDKIIYFYQFDVSQSETQRVTVTPRKTRTRSRRGNKQKRVRSEIVVQQRQQIKKKQRKRKPQIKSIKNKRYNPPH
jgi:glycosyltransferase involved in cell wall biosynthesis